MSKYSVKKPFTVFVAVIAVLVLGVVAFTRMTPDLLPSINLPYVIVVTPYPGASPEEVEQTVTKPLEQSMATLENINSISSTSNENYSMVVLEFTDNVNMDTATIDIREGLDTISGYWPSMVGTSSIIKINPNMLPVMVAAVDYEGMDRIELSNFLNDTVIPKLEGVTGVASVSTTGSVEKTLNVVINQDKIDEVNSRLYYAISSSLGSAGAKITNGQKELSDAQSKLTSGLESGAKELANVAFELQTQLNTLDTNIATYTAAVTAIESQQALLQPLAAEVDTAMATLTPEEQATLQSLFVRAATLQLDLSDPSNLSTEEQDALAALTAAGATQVQIAAKVSLTMLASSPAILEQMTQGRAALVAGMKEVDAAKISASVTGAAAQAQLDSAKTQLDSAYESFKEQRASALAAANIDGIVTANMVSNILTAQNFSMPAGYVEQDGVDYLVRVGDKFETAEDLENLLLVDMGLDNMKPIYLTDVADVYVSDNAADSYAVVNSNDGIILSFSKQSNYATASVGENLEDRFELLAEEYPGLTFTPLMNQGDYIYIIVNSVLQNLLLGALLAVIILFIFLRDIRPTFIIACSIPFSVICAIVLMYFSGVTLNIISLSGLAVGVGMLVDNSVVVIENIYRLRSNGVPALKAAVAGAQQMSGAIISSTLTTICVFLPIVFVDGLTRQLFTDMALTIAYSLLASLVVALTLVPAMSSSMLHKTHESKETFLDKALVVYEKALKLALNHRVIVVVLSIAIMVASFALTLSRGLSFMPDMESTEITVSLSMPEDYDMGMTREVANEVVEKIRSIDGVKTVGAMSGGGGAIMGMSLGGGGSNGVTMYVIMEDGAKLSNAEVSDQILDLCKDVPCEVSASGSSDVTSMMSALSGSGVSINVYNNNLDDLQTAANLVANALAGVDGIAETSNGINDSTPELRVIVDKNLAMAKGLTVAQVYSQLASAATTETSSTTLESASGNIGILITDEGRNPLTKETLNEYIITASSANGESEEIHLSEIATVVETQSLSSISRLEQRRYLTVSGTLSAGNNVTLVTNDAQRMLDGLELPEGTTLEYTGENETINEAMGQLMLMLGLAVILIYLIMVAQFQSLLSPFIVMFTIPLAFTGGLLALYICGMEVSVISMIGFIMLAGIIVNNGIVLIDSINQLRAEGYEINDAMLEAGKTRMRPILMTVLTTVLGLSTMALGIGTGAAIMQPIAIVCIGGLIYATLMTLFVIPVIYSFLGKKAVRAVSDDELTYVEEAQEPAHIM